jgi:hypothetical protein
MKQNQEVTIVIDPGSSGGYAICFGGLKAITLHNLQSPSDFIDHVLELEEIHKGFLRSVVEDVPSYAGKDVPSYTSFKLGRSCGFLEGVLRARQIPVEFISPRKWQKNLGGLKGLSGSPRKRVLKDHASRKYPLLKPTLKTCDALLMADYHFNSNPNI